VVLLGRQPEQLLAGALAPEPFRDGLTATRYGGFRAHRTLDLPGGITAEEQRAAPDDGTRTRVDAGVPVDVELCDAVELVGQTVAELVEAETGGLGQYHGDRDGAYADGVTHALPKKDLHAGAASNPAS